MKWFFLLLGSVALHAQSGVPAQITRGEAIFSDSAKGCAACHSLQGKGTAVGPDLKGIARLSPKGIAMAIRSTVTQYVQTAKLKSGDSFPAMAGTQDDKTVVLYNLSKMPPEMQKVDKGDVSLSANNGWKHPPSDYNLTDEQMADIVAYVRYAGAGNKTPVQPEDIQ